MHTLLCLCAFRFFVFSPICSRYGESQGSPSETGIVKDSQAALDHLLQRTDINRKKLVIFGRSLGGAVGASLLYRNPGKVQYRISETVHYFTATVLHCYSAALLQSHSVGMPQMRRVLPTLWSTVYRVGHVRVCSSHVCSDTCSPRTHVSILFARFREW